MHHLIIIYPSNHDIFLGPFLVRLSIHTEFNWLKFKIYIWYIAILSFLPDSLKLAEQSMQTSRGQGVNLWLWLCVSPVGVTMWLSDRSTKSQLSCLCNFWIVLPFISPSAPDHEVLFLYGWKLPAMILHTLLKAVSPLTNILSIL